MNAAIYLRPTSAEGYDFHLEELEARACADGNAVIHVYLDSRISGRTGSDARPGLSQLLQDAQSGAFSVLYIQRYDCLSHNFHMLLETLETLQCYEVAVRPADSIEYTALALYADLIKHPGYLKQKRVCKNSRPLPK